MVVMKMGSSFLCLLLVVGPYPGLCNAQAKDDLGPTVRYGVEHWHDLKHGCTCGSIGCRALPIYMIRQVMCASMQDLGGYLWIPQRYFGATSDISLDTSRETLMEVVIKRVKLFFENSFPH